MRKARFAAFVLFSLAVLCMRVLPQNPELIERYYSRSFYPMAAGTLSRITGLVRFSVAEYFLLAAGLFVVLSLLGFVLGRRKHHQRQRTKPFSVLLNALTVIGFGYFLFTLLWALNYRRLPYASIAGLETEPASLETLEALCRELIDDANSLRKTLKEDTDGVMVLSDGPKTMLAQADLGFLAMSAENPELGGVYGPPKPLLFSKALTYAGLSGIYSVYSAEPCVNMMIPEHSLPSTACHEMAHQRGFAREDEANYIAYVVCMAHPDPDFRYSGTLLAAIHSMNALWRYDRELYANLYATYSESVTRDLRAHREFWKRYEGPAERVTDRINDAYLKAQGQADGVHSYGRMVDLLLARRKKLRMTTQPVAYLAGQHMLHVEEYSQNE